MENVLNFAEMVELKGCFRDGAQYTKDIEGRLKITEGAVNTVSKIGRGHSHCWRSKKGAKVIAECARQAGKSHLAQCSRPYELASPKSGQVKDLL